MTKFVIRRVLQAIPVLFGITVVVYGILLAAPGGPEAKFANNPRITQEQKDKFIKAWGLDQPIPVQYCRWMGFCNPDTEGTVFGSLPTPAAFLGPTGLPNFLPEFLSGATNGVLHGDFGYSINSGEKVEDRIIRAALPTFILAGVALVVWLVIAIVMGVYAAIHRYSLFDNGATVFAYVGFAMPTFWLGIMLIFIFSGPGLNILPAGGMTETRLSPPFGSDKYWAYFGANPIQALGDIGRHLILPVITLVVVNIAGDSRFVRAALPTFILAGVALIVWLTIAIVMGVYAAIHRYSLFDNGATVFAYVGFAMPTFWLGIMLIFIFSGPGLNILPAGGMTETRLSPPFGSDKYWAYFGANPVQALGDIGRHLILPVITLVVVNIAGDSRFVRASMLETLGQDYVRTAKAKGLPSRVVNFKHALRNALLPVITNIGLEIPFLFTGAIVTETIFSWPGIGKLTIDATREFDYPILMGVLLVTSVLVVLANLLADIAYGVVDPRIKY